jgi:hypothetical protein
MDRVRVVCNCDDVLILVFHAAFENDRFPLKQHASVIISMSRTPKTPTGQSTSFSHIRLDPAKRGCHERPLGVCGYQYSEARHIPAALRHMHDVVTCGGVDGGSIKPPDERRR